MLNLSVILEDSARRYPTKAAFTFMDTTLNFAQVNGAANQIANGLKARGIQPGDKVALSCFNLPTNVNLISKKTRLTFYCINIKVG